MIPFTHVIEAQGIREGCSYYLQAELEQLSTMMADSNELEIRAVLGLNVLVQQPVEELIIDRIQEKPLDMAKIQSMAGITVYMVKPGESMWDVNIFGKTLEQLVGDGMQTKALKMTDESQQKLQDTMEKIINESNGGLVCIII